MSSPSSPLRRMTGRDPNEAHRASSALELLVDLTFAAAISLCADSLQQGLDAGRIVASLEAYPTTFFGIWWAWINFTWFSSAYDTDDIPYRLATFCQMTGVLILAAGIPRAFQHDDYAVIVVGFVVMRLGLVSQWLRAAWSDPAHRRTALRYGAGLVVLQVCWSGLLLVPSPYGHGCFAVLVVLELALPWWAERAGATDWHPRHIAERYGLLTLILIGESVLNASVGLQTALGSGRELGAVVPDIAGGLLIVFGLWWLYFDQPTERAVEEARQDWENTPLYAFIWGYGHFVVFAGAAATGAGLAIAIDHHTKHVALGARGAGLAATVPVALYVLVLWLLHLRQRESSFARVLPVAAASLILAAAWTPQPVLVTGLLLAAAVAAATVDTRRGASAGSLEPGSGPAFGPGQGAAAGGEDHGHHHRPECDGGENRHPGDAAGKAEDQRSDRRQDGDGDGEHDRAPRPALELGGESAHGQEP